MIRRRLRAVGSYVPLSDTFPKTVAFIVGTRDRDGVRRQLPIGTGFFLGYRKPLGSLGRLFTTYLVTAAHVVRTEPETWVRVRRADGSLEDLPVPEWEFHHRDDVAVAVMELPDSEPRFDVSVMPYRDFVDMGYRPMAGDRVYFIGLFSPIPAMGERNVPLVRSGTLAAWRQSGVPIRTSGGDRFDYTAHLIDCRSYAGFSGSPCVVQFPRELSVGKAGSGVGRPDEATQLIGLVSSHFDQRENADLTGEMADMGKVGVPVSLGVAAVMPAESIEEVLESEDVVADRERREDEGARRAQEDQMAATPDVVPSDPTDRESEYERFAGLARRVAQVPKREIDEKRKKES